MSLLTVIIVPLVLTTRFKYCFSTWSVWKYLLFHSPHVNVLLLLDLSSVVFFIIVCISQGLAIYFSLVFSSAPLIWEYQHCMYLQNLFFVLQYKYLSWALFLYFFSSVSLSILFSVSSVAELLWSLYQHDSCSIKNKMEGKKEKRKSISGFIPLWFTGFAKVSVHSDWQQIEIYYQCVSIVNRGFLSKWTYQKLMKLFSLSSHFLVCHPQGLVLIQ